MWDSLKLLGEDDWLLTAIREGTCTAVTDGSYIREIFDDVCSCGFVFECSKGRGRILGSFPEQSSRACAYRGELLGLMAIHLILLAVNKVHPQLRGKVRIVYSDCLGALNKVTTLLTNRIPSGRKHSDILKNIMIHCSNLSFDCEYLHVEAHQDESKAYLQLAACKAYIIKLLYERHHGKKCPVGTGGQSSASAGHFSTGTGGSDGREGEAHVGLRGHSSVLV